MCTKQCNRVKISRLRMKTTLPILFLAIILITQNIYSTQASADYGEADDFQASSSSNDGSINMEAVNTNVVLQQEVEAGEHRSNMEMEDTETEEAMATERMSRRENMTHEHGGMDSEEDYDQDDDDANHNMHMMTTAKSHGMTATTTMIPEYVRKAKSEHHFASNENSDYTDDEKLSSRERQQHELTKKNDNNKDYHDGIVPLAIKYYQNDGYLAEEDNKLKDPQSNLMPHQQQLLPKEQAAQQFHPNSSEEDFYENDTERSGTNGNNNHHYHRDHHNGENDSRATSAPPVSNNTPTPLPTYQPINNIEAIGRATIPGFPIPFSGSWNTTTTTTYTQTATVEPNKDAAAAAAATTPSALGVHTATMGTGLSESPLSSTPPSLSSATQSPTATTIMTTTLRPAGKQGKQINISRRKLLPHEQLRNYIEDAYIRMPLAVIVDPSAESLEKTKALWRDALRTNLNIKIVLVSLNASGIPAAYNFNNTRQFLAGLNSIKEHDGGNAFIGIVHASELVPYDSAVFISTASIPPHTELVQDAAITLLKKRIRLYLIWYGERAISENETQEAVGGILGEVAIRSGGEILHIVGSENSQELEGSTLTLVADAFRGSQDVDIAVDTTLSSLHVKIDSPMRTATLETPNGDINLKKLVKFKSRILTLGPDDKRLDAYVPLTKLRKATVYKLKMVPESLDHEYSVFVRADRKADLFLDDMIKRFDTYFMEGISSYPTRFYDTRLQSITSALAAATIPTHDNLKYPDDDEDEEKNETKEPIDSKPKTEVETFSETEIYNSKTPAVSTNSTISDMAKATLSNQQRESTVNVLQRGVTKIEMGTQSQVLVAPGMMGQLQFEITNTRSEAVYHNIQVVDERRFLLRLAPQSIFLRPGEMISVSVTLLVPNGTPQGTIDRITFTCHGGGTTMSLSLNLKVITTVDSQDTTPPSISWTFGSRCEYISAESSNCAERFWTMDITAQDSETGIMRLQSTPVGSGLIYRSTYTVGSRDELKATYIATCCEPKVALTAYDIAGNQRSYNVDVRDIVLTEASIAAIVLGVILLILLIILLIAGIVWCCKRRQVSLDLPTYRSHSTRSME